MPTVDPDVTSLLASFVAFASPIVVDALKRDTWKPSTSVLIGAIVSLVIYVGLHLLLGTLTYPVTLDFLQGAFAAIGWQYAGYALLFRDRSRVIEVPGPATTTVVSSAPTVVTDGSVNTQGT